MVDVPKDVQFASGRYTKKNEIKKNFIKKEPSIDLNMLDEAINRLELAERPIIYSGGGVINSGQSAVNSLRNLVAGTNFPNNFYSNGTWVVILLQGKTGWEC